MKKTTKAIASVVISSALIGSLGVSSSAFAGGKDKEKCYGVVKAGKNDCATKTSSCAGSSTKDSQKDAFVALPKGVCSKLVGGSTKSS